MIEGRVSSSQAIVEIEVASGTGRLVRIPAIVDPGYNGSLALPSKMVAALSLRFAGYRVGRLADGSRTVLTMYISRARWQGRSKIVVIMDGALAPLIGMTLISGSRLTIDVVEGGPVTIVELSATQ